MERIKELVHQLENIVNNEEAAIFIKHIKDTPVGSVQCVLRYDYVEGRPVVW